MEKHALGKYILALLLYGSNGLATHFLSLSSHETVFLRSLLGCVFLVTLYFLSGRRLHFLQHRKDLAFIALSGAAMAADWLLLFEAYLQIGVSLSILINYCGPAIVIALSPLVLKERILPRKIIALIAAFVGVILISGSAVFGGVNAWGLACAILSAFCYAAMVLANKKAVHVKGMDNAMVQLVVTFACVGVFFLLRQGISLSIRPMEIFPLLWLGIANTGFGCFLYFSSIGALSAQTVGVLGYIEPLFGVLLAALFLGESMTVFQIIGAVLIIGGAVYGELHGKRPCA